MSKFERFSNDEDDIRKDTTDDFRKEEHDDIDKIKSRKNKIEFKDIVKERKFL